jgi:hypothetical protein
MEYLAQELGALQPAGLYACVVLFLGHFFGVSHFQFLIVLMTL